MTGSSELAHDVLPETVDDALAGERDQGDAARLARLEPHGRAGRNVEPHAARLLAIELERRIGFKEMIVRADLDRPVAGIGDAQRDQLAALVELDLAILDEELAGDHVNLALTDRLVHGDELGAIRERRLDLDLGDHFGDPVHDLRPREDMRTGLHQVRDGATVAGTFQNEIAYQRNRLRMIELHAAL